MARAYFASKLSDNIGQTPEGYLICTSAIVGRDGFQDYLIENLPQETAKELGVDLSNPKAKISLYRPHEEVFSPSTLASLEGKPVTDSHPTSGFVDTTNFKNLACGHLQNIRKGWETLDTGEWPILADLIITDPKLIEKVQNGYRELSLGYDYTLKREGQKLCQTDIIANHCAVVDRARAGPEARIYDAATIESQEAPIIGTKPIETKFEVKPEDPAIKTTRKEYTVTNVLKHILGLGFKQYATDADPEKLADALEVVSKAKARDAEEESEEEERKKKEKDAADAKRAKDESEREEKKKEEDRKAKDAKDAAEAEEKKKKEESDAKDAKDAADKKAKDAKEESHFSPCTTKDCMARDCRMHDALDSILKEHPEDDDKDMNELKDIMGEFMGGGGEEHDGSEMIEPIMDGETEKEKEKEEDKALANDAAAEFDFLKKMRPVVARSNDKALISEFNARLSRFTRSSKPNAGASYGAFARSAATGRDDKDGLQKKRDPKALDEVYAQLRSKDLREVK